MSGEIVSAFYSRSAELNELFSALAKAQAKFRAAQKAGKSNFGKHPTLESVFEATSEGRAENNLALVQMPGNGDGNNIAVTTILGHSSGQWIESRFQVAPMKFDAQGAGSVVTYLRRYAAMSILGIAPEDDDGDAAVGQLNTKSTSASTPPANGKKHPKWDYAGARFREIERALSSVNESKMIDDIWMVNKTDLQLIEQLHQPSYQRLEKLRDEMLAKLGSLNLAAGSAPGLMGEP